MVVATTTPMALVSSTVTPWKPGSLLSAPLRLASLKNRPDRVNGRGGPVAVVDVEAIGPAGQASA